MRKPAASTINQRSRAAGYVLCAALLLFAVRGAFAWSERDYAVHDYRSFGELPAARGRIDFRRIDYPLLDAALFYETNRERAAHGKRAFRHSAGLERAAQGHSEDMARHGFLSHESPVKGKTTLDDRLAGAGFPLIPAVWGENIGMVFGIEYESGKKVYPPDEDTPYFRYGRNGKPLPARTYAGLAQEAVREWMSSPDHRRNILSDEFRELGTGSAHFTDPQFFNIDMFKVTQDFYGGKDPVRRKP